MRECGVVTAGVSKFAYQPSTDLWGGDPAIGNIDKLCYCQIARCANGYIYKVWTDNCRVSARPTCRNHDVVGSQYSVTCPHGTIPHQTWHCGSSFAKCHIYAPGVTTGTSDYIANLNYVAPCGRKNHKTDDIYGYVTRTRTTSYNKKQFQEIMHTHTP